MVDWVATVAADFMWRQRVVGRCRCWVEAHLLHDDPSAVACGYPSGVPGTFGPEDGKVRRSSGFCPVIGTSAQPGVSCIWGTLVRAALELVLSLSCELVLALAGARAQAQGLARELARARQLAHWTGGCCLRTRRKSFFGYNCRRRLCTPAVRRRCVRFPQLHGH